MKIEVHYTSFSPLTGTASCVESLLGCYPGEGLLPPRSYIEMCRKQFSLVSGIEIREVWARIKYRLTGKLISFMKDLV